MKRRATYKPLLPCMLLLATVLLYNCASQKKYTVTETRRLQTVQALPKDDIRDTIHSAAPAIAINRQGLKYKTIPGKLAADAPVAQNKPSKATILNDKRSAAKGTIDKDLVIQTNKPDSYEFLNWEYKSC